jgi:hypothetical protein
MVGTAPKARPSDVLQPLAVAVAGSGVKIRYFVKVIFTNYNLGKPTCPTRAFIFYAQSHL